MAGSSWFVSACAVAFLGPQNSLPFSLAFSSLATSTCRPTPEIQGYHASRVEAAVYLCIYHGYHRSFPYAGTAHGTVRIGSELDIAKLAGLGQYLNKHGMSLCLVVG